LGAQEELKKTNLKGVLVKRGGRNQTEVLSLRKQKPAE